MVSVPGHPFQVRPKFRDLHPQANIPDLFTREFPWVLVILQQIQLTLPLAQPLTSPSQRVM